MKRIERTQTGLRLEKRMLKVLKGLAEHLDMSLGELVECMVLHAFDGRTVFTERTREKIAKLCEVYEMDLSSADSHALQEEGA